MPAVIDVQLLPHPVSVQPLATGDSTWRAGAECVFLGRTREERHDAHGRLVRLSYEAFADMARSVLHRLAEEAVERFGCLAVRIHHALGEVPPGEASVLVQVLAAHRGAAFDACRFLIDRLKAEAPIWKREVWDDGATWSPGTPIEEPVE